MDAVRYKVLVVDDEPDDLLAHRGLLEAEGFSVITACNADEALGTAADSRPDIVLSDVSMPEADGRRLLQRLKGDARTAAIPVVLISGAFKDEPDVAEGLELGADDYLPKPCSPRLMAARLRAVLRRYAAPKELEEMLQVDGVRLDVSARTVSRGGRAVALTRKEFDLLTTFLRRRGRVLSVPFLLETVWGYDPADYNDPRTVAVHVSSLRKKLGSPIAERLVAVSGLGYRLD